MSLVALDFLLTIFHLFIIGFNLLGWVFKPTKKLHFYFAMLTLFCWVVLGIWYGIGYCPITDWQWNIKAQLGEQDLPASFIKYCTDRFIGLNINADLIDALTLLFFLMAIIASIKVNFYKTKLKPQ
ncbi:DUF2784 domain-containing protein [Pedobacter cryotolerans]|uniref:DUF2784 domain-containing protein n=1 Tax=Pedobacter cryotolerans TaxID=2571270 RepID=A0A4V5NY48_9SPHI|nr:DUF2784 domain-containing protein [Pedobacter cryotolerans]TKC02127.1 DUF2784 domain-containing protein [Pedobacter cryotolerans]